MTTTKTFIVIIDIASRVHVYMLLQSNAFSLQNVLKTLILKVQHISVPRTRPLQGENVSHGAPPTHTSTVTTRCWKARETTAGTDYTDGGVGMLLGASRLTLIRHGNTVIIYLAVVSNVQVF